MASDYAYQLYYIKGAESYYNLNTTIKPFDNINIRKGLAMSIDRQTLVDKIAQGGQIPAEGVVPFGMLDENGEEYRNGVGNLNEYNVEKAKELFQKGLEETGFKAEDFSQFSILYNTSEGHKKIAQAIQEIWRQNLGIEIQLEAVILKHAVRNAILPIISVLRTLVSNLIVGSFVVEKIFGIPGLGSFFVNSINNRDYTLIMGTTVFYSIILIVMLLLVDIAYMLVDPRIKLTKEGR